MGWGFFFKKNDFIFFYFLVLQLFPSSLVVLRYKTEHWPKYLQVRQMQWMTLESVWGLIRFLCTHLFLASASSLCIPSLRFSDARLTSTMRSALWEYCQRNWWHWLTVNSELCSCWKCYMIIVIRNSEGVRSSILHNVCWFKALNYGLSVCLICS